MNLVFTTIILMAALLTGCDVPSRTSTQIEAVKQEELNKQAVQAVGLPSIVNFQEKRTYKMILELRDTGISTYTYLVGMNNELKLLCKSVGYAIPYATQYTNPQKDIYYGSSSNVHLAMPQADPNGLYSPSSADGTWILCLGPNGKTSPVYVEPKIVVSTFPLN